MKNLSRVFAMIRALFTAPVFEGDEEKTRSAKLLHQIAMASWSLPFVAGIVSILNPTVVRFALRAGIVLAVTLAVIMFLNRAGKVRLASNVIVGMVLIVLTYLNYSGAGEPRPLLLLTVIAIVMSGLLFGSRGPIVVAILLAAQHAFILILYAKGLIVPQSAPAGPLQNAVVTTVSYLLIGFMLRLAIARLQFALNQVRENEAELKIRNRELQELSASLEQRVSDRTKALAASTEVSRSISTILDQRQLLTEAVEQVQAAFNYHHAHIYLLNEAGDELVMAGGTGEAGQTLLARGHKISKGKGLVGRAGETNTVALVSDVSKNPDWLSNPLLPETKSEVALPISIGDQVLGVLDVQQNIANSLQQEDVEAMQPIANQIAIALQNIRQFENSRKIASDLGVVANVGIATSTITESGHLLQEVIDLSKKSFNLYHAHIYVLNEAGDALDLASGAGEVGKQMVSEKHSIPLDSEKSLVARAARTRAGVVVNDVTTAPDFLPNPLLPDTRSEMAVPLIVAGKVIGVLDVQSETANRFTDVDVSIQTTLASQVAVALQNARTFSQSQRQAEHETAVNLITQKIQGATTVESVLQITARELGRAVGSKQTRVILKDYGLTAPTEK